MKNFEKKYNVSRETYEKLSDFVAILTEWQEKMNLVSPQSMAEIWTRHIADSYQLFQYLNNNIRTVYDIGSGAGFPGVVLAITSQTENCLTHFTLIESITKKTVYLNDVKEKLGLQNVDILNARAESLNLSKADVITARAVANLSKLFDLSSCLADKKTVFYFLKGRTYQEELNEAKKRWRFEYEINKSTTSEDGVVLKISQLEKKGKIK